MVDISRLTSGASDLLPEEVSTEIFAKAQDASAVMQLAQQMKVTGPGVAIPVITGDAEAEWVNETDEAPVSNATLAKKSLTPHTLVVIEAFSKEFLRDLPGLYEELVTRLPAGLATKFDKTVFGTVAPGDNFATLGGCADVALAPGTGDKTTYKGLVEAYAKVGEVDGALNGWALSNKAKALLLNATDTTHRPLLVESIIAGSAVPALLGEPVSYTKGAYSVGDPANTIGFAGDWDQARWGMVNQIEVTISDQATINDGTKQLNLFQRGMFAIRAEVSLGFQVKDLGAFVRLTDAKRT